MKSASLKEAKKDAKACAFQTEGSPVIYKRILSEGSRSIQDVRAQKEGFKDLIANS
jgi:hypothetical protein